jgi:hypothetical protein
MEARVISAIAKAELSHQNLKKLMNSFFLSFFLHFQNALQSKSFDLRNLPAFFLPVHEMRVLPPWSEHVYWVSARQLPLSFPFPSLSFHTC